MAKNIDSIDLKNRSKERLHERERKTFYAELLNVVEMNRYMYIEERKPQQILRK